MERVEMRIQYHCQGSATCETLTFISAELSSEAPCLHTARLSPPTPPLFTPLLFSLLVLSSVCSASLCSTPAAPPSPRHTACFRPPPFFSFFKKKATTFVPRPGVVDKVALTDKEVPDVVYTKKTILLDLIQDKECILRHFVCSKVLKCLKHFQLRMRKEKKRS